MQRAEHTKSFSFKDGQQHGVFKTVVFAIVFLCTAAFVLYKCRFGFGNIDEAFYLATPLRLFQGDALFSQEWHLSQMSSVLLWPIVSAFVQITGGCEGIILFMRYACTAIQLLTAAFIYLKLRGYHWLGAALASISFALYTPYGIMALSYNSMGILALTVALVICATAKKPMHYVAAGIAFSAAVLCCPYLAVLYFLCVLLFILCVKKKKLDGRSHVRSFGFFTIGIGFSAIAFLIFVFSRTSIKDVVASIPFILADPQHPPVSLLKKTAVFFISTLNIVPVSRNVHISLLVLFVVCLADKKRKTHAALYLIPAVLAVLQLLYQLAVVSPYINFVMWPMNLLAPFIALLSSHKAIRRLFFMFFCPGIFYACCINLTSNQAFYAISSASSVSTVASILMLCLYISEWRCFTVKHPVRMVAALCLAMLFVLQLSAQIQLRYESVFWENGMEDQTQYIAEGVYKGTFISKEKEKVYLDSKAEMDRLKEYAEPGDQVLFLSRKTWFYLMEDYRNASYSAWLAGVDEATIDRLEAYYSINPQKKPDVVYADADLAAQLFAERFGYQITQTDQGWILYPVG